MRFLSITVFMLALAVGSSVSAQDSDAPRLRLDFESGGSLGAWSAGGDLPWGVNARARIALRNGDGAYVGISSVTSDEPNLFGPSPAHVSMTTFEGGYLRRFRLLGNDRFGLGLDVMGGITVALPPSRSTGDCGSSWSTNSSGWSCPTHAESPEQQQVSRTLHVGPSAGASLDLRLRGFVVGLDVNYRLLLTDPQPGARTDQHVLQAGIHFGFGF